MSVDIGTLLRDVADRSETLRLPDPDEVRLTGDRRARRQRLQVFVGLALVVTMAGALGRGMLERDAAPQPVNPLPIPGPTSTVGPDVGGPAIHAIETGPQRFSAHAIAVHDGRFVVVGDSSDFDTRGSAVYWSDDAVRWHAPQRGARPQSGNVTDVIATASGFLAVGVEGRRSPGAWRSVDGVSWSRSPVRALRSGGLEALWGVTATRFGYFAWGHDGGHAAIWRSSDGRAWASVGGQDVFDLPGRESICVVRQASGGLIAPAEVTPRHSLEGRRVVWSSQDGAHWVLSRGPSRQTFWCDRPGHVDARSPGVGEVRIDPNGEGETVSVSTP